MFCPCNPNPSYPLNSPPGYLGIDTPPPMSAYL